MAHLRKYGRNGKTFHLPFSPGTDSTDRKNWRWWDNITKGVKEGEYKDEKGFEDVLPQEPIREIVVTEKLDGQGNQFSPYGLFARSVGAPSELPWDRTLRQKWALIKNDLADFGIEIFGENMYACHSIEYLKLEHDFYCFAVRQDDKWLSWEEVKYYAELFDFPTVPVLDQFKVVDKWQNEQDCQKYVEDICKAPSTMGSIDFHTKELCTMEGIVFRNIEGYHVNNFVQNLFKWVRPDHVQPGADHWSKWWRPAFKYHEIQAFLGKENPNMEECMQAIIQLENKK